MDIVDRAIRNWKLHVLALVLTIIAELIGAKTFKVGPGILVLVPLLYSFALGALCGLPKLKILKREDMFEASSLVGVTFFFLMARYGTLVGPSFWKVVESGPALILQEFGNLGTVFFGVPIAVLLGLKREAVGAAFSNAREPNIAIIGEKYGLDTPEGRGVMGVYVTGTVFGVAFDFTSMPIVGRVFLALVVCIVLCTAFAAFAGFFTAKFKMHWFISTMANMLIIFGLLTYATKGVSFGSIETSIPNMMIPKINGFPTIILWAVAAIAIVWFIWNKTTFGKNMYAVGGNPEAAAVSGISVFKVMFCTFILAGVLYGFGSWLECMRMVGSGSAAYGQGWETDAIAACVVGGVSFTGGIGKISGVTIGVLIFTALTYSLTILGVDTNLQFVFSGIIILLAVTLDCLKYIQKK